MITEAYYKVLGENGDCHHGGQGTWHLPHGKRPGKWMPKIPGALEPCKNGYHILKAEHILQWIGPTLWEVEIRGDVLWDTDKGVVAQARLLRKVETFNSRTLRLFAADCAESVLHLFEDKYPDDDRPRKAIEAARLYANGQIGDAAWSAARAAARDAAWAATGAAAGAAARAAARAAAWDAWAAAGDAAWAAAWDAEHLWQQTRFAEYLSGERA